MKTAQEMGRDSGSLEKPQSPETVIDPVADLARRLLRENTILQDEVDRLNTILGQYRKCS
jgi:hypothetical protein